MISENSVCIRYAIPYWIIGIGLISSGIALLVTVFDCYKKNKLHY